MIQPDLQQGLFKTPREEALKNLNIGIATVQQWHKEKYLSFKIENVDELEDIQYKELAFISTIFKSGISLETVNLLLAKLDKPYAYNLSHIYYNFYKQEWDYIPQRGEFEIDNIEDLSDTISSIIYNSSEEDIEFAKNIITELEDFINENNKE